MKLTDYREDLIKRLKNPKYAVEYINAILKSGNEGDFLMALKDVADAHGGVRWLSKKSGLNREHLFRMLSKRGHPRIDNVQKVFEAFGWRIAAIPDSSHVGRAA